VAQRPHLQSEMSLPPHIWSLLGAFPDCLVLSWCAVCLAPNVSMPAEDNCVPAVSKQNWPAATVPQWKQDTRCDMLCCRCEKRMENMQKPGSERPAGHPLQNSLPSKNSLKRKNSWEVDDRQVRLPVLRQIVT